MIVNIPHEKEKEPHLEVNVVDQQVYVMSIEGNRNEQHAVRVHDVFVGDHMFEPKNREHLRRMMGQEIVRAIEAGRRVGYLQAQADIREALGVAR